MIARPPKIVGCTFLSDLVEKPGLLFLQQIQADPASGGRAEIETV